MTELVITLPGASIDLVGTRVLRDGQAVKVEPRAWRVLEHLARFRHRVVTKEELRTALRLEGEVSEGALRQAVRAARLAIGDDGPGSAIRAIPRVGYILDVPPASAPEPPAARLSRADMPSVIIGPLRDETGRPSLRWAAHGLEACVALGLSLDGSLQVQQAQSLGASWPRRRLDLLQTLHAAGARFAVLGSLRPEARGFVLELQIHGDGEASVVAVRAAAAAGLVAPAIEALRHRLLGDGAQHAEAGRWSTCSLRAIELFARASHSAGVHNHAAALRALELLHRLEPGFPGLDLERLRARAICGSGDVPADAARLLARARGNDDTALEAQVHRCLGTLHHVQGRLREAAQSFGQALVLGRGCMPAHWCGEALTQLASVECRLGELHAIRARLDEAQAIFTRIGSHWGLLNVMWLRAIMSSLSGHAEQSIRWNRKLVKVARRLHAHTALASACLNLAGELVYADRLEEAREAAEEATATVLAFEGGVDLLSTVANVHCLLHRLQGRPDAAAAVLSLLPDPASLPDDGCLWQAHGHVAMARGRSDEAADCFLRAAHAFRRSGHRVGEAPLMPWLVEALVRDGRLRLAQAELDRAGTQPHLQDEATTANLLYPRARLARARQEQHEARTLLARLATSPAAMPLYRRLGQDLSSTPVEAPSVPPAPMTPGNNLMQRQHRFANCMLDVERRELWIDGRRQTIAPRPFDVLVHLYRHRHRVVTQDELLDAVWGAAVASPEVVAQAIARIRQTMRRSQAHATSLQTVYGKGYRLLADVRREPDDDSAAALLADPHATPLPALAVMPLPGGKRTAGTADRGHEHAMEVLGHTLALHARLKRMSGAELQASTEGAPEATPEAVAATIGSRSPRAHVLFARLARIDETVALDYVLVSPAGRLEGVLRDRSPAGLGRRLAARLLRLNEDSAGAGAEDGWMSGMLDLASRAAEEHRWDAALQILEVVLDQDPDHDGALDLKARIDDRAGATMR